MMSDVEMVGVHQTKDLWSNGCCGTIYPCTVASEGILTTGRWIEKLSLAFRIVYILSKFVKCTNVESMATQGRQYPVIA